MPYTPPAGNAVIFNFTGGVAYLPPSGNHVIFNFGSVPLPPAGTTTLRQATSGLMLEREDDPAWSMRRPAPVIGQVIPPAPSWVTVRTLRDEEDAPRVRIQLLTSFIVRPRPMTFVTA